MQAGSSQMAAAASQMPAMVQEKKERKPRHKVTKGKEREEEAQKQAKAAVTVVDDDKATENWAWTSLTNNSISSRPAVFTNDFRYFFVIVGSSVKIYATATGQVVSTLSSSNLGSGSSSSSHPGEGHTDEITTAFINPRNPFQLMTASLDGRIKVWDYLEASLLSTLEVGEPITHMCAHDAFPEHVFVATTSTKAKKDKDTSKVYRIALRPSSATADLPIHKPSDIHKIGKMRTTNGMAISPSGEWLVAIGGPKAYVCPLSGASYGFTKFVSNEVLTCLAFHPTDEYFATGDTKGQIRLWYCLDPAQVTTRANGDKKAQTTTLHWHAHAVSSIAFSSNGSYLLSGGEEAVLVIWQLHSGKKEFVPRVGAPITSLAVAGHRDAEEEYLLALSDGTLAFVGSGTLRISRSIARIKHDAGMWGHHPAPLAVHTQTSTVILPAAHPSSLLIYSPTTSTLISELEVSPSNRVSRQDEKHIEPSRIKHVVVSPDGAWLATIDGRDGGEDFQYEVYLKIWQWHAASTSWVLNSRIDRPHGTKRVSAVVFAFAPAYEHPHLVSTGEDGNVKVWRVRSIAVKNGEKEVFWICRSTLNYRSKTPSNVVSSPDGSLFAVTYERHVALYETSTNIIRATLFTPDGQDVCHTAFIGSSGRYFIVTDNKQVVLWDLVTLSVRWEYFVQETILHLIPHPNRDAFVIICRGNTASAPAIVHKFGISSPNQAVKRTLPFKLKKVTWYPYIITELQSTQDWFSLIGITSDWTSVLFGDRVISVEDEGADAREIAPDATPHRRSLFQDIFGVSALDSIPSTLPAVVPTPAVTRDDTVLKASHVLNTPAHLLPPLETLYKPLVETFLKERRIEHKAVMETAPEEKEDAVMEDAVIAVAASAGRVIPDEEMDAFIELFKGDLFSSSTKTKTKPTAHTHKHKHINGNGVVNGSHPKASVPVSVSTSATSTPKGNPMSIGINGKGHPPNTAERQQGDSSPAVVVVGKKRKKSMG